jgi:electron-transferring-flavoprotein dehydrogenase
MVRASDYPPPFRAADYVVEPTDPADERIEVGLLIVGGGPAGLACAIRFGQLLADDPELTEQLGDVPVAVLEKGKQPGAQLLSGAVVNPRSLQTLFGPSFRIEDVPGYGRVPGEAVYVLSRKKALRIPPPPPMRNHGNYIFSVAELGGWLGDKAEELGATILPETVGQSLLVTDGRVQGVRTGDKGRAMDGQELSNFEVGSDIAANITVLADGSQGHLSGVALDHFGLRGNEPQVWELGVKEVWKVPKPLTRIIHTMGWPLRPQAKYHEFGGSFIYPVGPDLVTIGLVVGLDYRDVAVSVHDMLQELKTHPLVREILAGGERLEWGAKTIPSGGFHALPTSMHAPGLLLTGDGIGLVNIPRLKGIHYAIESGRLAAESAYQSMKAAGGEGDLGSYDAAVRSSFIYSDLHKVRDMRQVFARGFVVGGALASAMTASGGRINVGKVRSHSDDSHELLRTDRAASYPEPDGTLTFDKLSSVFASGNKTRDDQPDHIRLEKQVPAEVAELWHRMCPAHVYEIGATGADGLVTVHVAPSNCVHCGAISAKGGRFTPPEGGSGPEYQRT